MVHGDDFTSLGSDANLDRLEKELATFFELKIRGRLGVGCPGDDEIRILNRLVRVTSEGLEYEADPRHVDLIVESLELADSKPVATPGVKNPIPELEAQKTSEPASSTPVQVDESETAASYPENLLDMLCAITSDNDLVYASISTTCVQSRRMTVYPESALSKSGDKIRHSHSVSFDENMNTYHNVSAYSRHYGFLPQSYVATAKGWKPVSVRADHFTGKDDAVMANRRKINAQKRDVMFIDQFRRSMVRTMFARAAGEQTLLTPLTIHSFLSTHQSSQPANSRPETGRKVGTHADGHAGQANADHAAINDVMAANISVDEFVAMHDATPTSTTIWVQHLWHQIGINFPQSRRRIRHQNSRRGWEQKP